MDDGSTPDEPPAGGTAADRARLAAELGALNDSSNPFVAAVRATRMPMIVTNPRLPDNPVVFANDAFCRLTGYARAEIVGRNCRFLQGSDTDPVTVARIHAAVASRQAIEIDIRNYRKTGEPFWNRLLLAPVRDPSGELAYFFASQVDVTLERERLAGLETHNAALSAELAGRLYAQQEREQELRFALEAGQLGAWTLDLATDELTTSAICREAFGRAADASFTYVDLQAALHPADLPGMLAALRRSVDTRSDFDAAYRIITPAGETRWLAVRGRPAYAAGGVPLRMSGVLQDITDQKRNAVMRQALADLAEALAELPSTTELSFAAADVLGRTLGLFHAALAQVDAPAGTLTVERDWSAGAEVTLRGVTALAELGAAEHDLRAGRPVIVPDAGIAPGGPALVGAVAGLRARALVLMPLLERGQLVGLLLVHDRVPRAWHADELGFMRQVADRTQAALVRRDAERKLALLNVSLERQVADRTAQLMTAEEALRQSQKMEAIGQLTGGVAHDFNNLLTVIRSSIDLMRRPDLAEERRRRYIDAISDTVNRAAKLTGQLLAFARRQALKPEVFDVRARLRDIAEMLDSVTGARVRVVVEVPEEPCWVRADVSQFETALVNMAVNARDAMAGAGVLTLRLRGADTIPPIRGHAAAHGRFAAVSLTDTGAGIAPDRLPRIFEPFFTTKAVGKGTGLGLSQVFGFAKQSGGDVDVTSGRGEGATFTLYLPEIEAIAADGEAADAPGAPALTAKGGGRRVLVVEDNLDVGGFSTQLLQDLGYDTAWATNADEALAMLERDGGSFDVVFSDVVMPGMSGIDLAKEIARRRPALPVVLTSGYSHVLAEEGTHGFELLHKPYSAEQLSRVLRTATRRRPRAAS